MSFYDTVLTGYTPVVEAIAAEAGRANRRWGAEQADYSQQLHMWVWENRDMLSDRYAEFEDANRFQRFLAKCLRNECADYSLDIRAQAGGQDRQSAYWYTTGELKALLDAL